MSAKKELVFSNQQPQAKNEKAPITYAVYKSFESMEDEIENKQFDELSKAEVASSTSPLIKHIKVERINGEINVIFDNDLKEEFLEQEEEFLEQAGNEADRIVENINKRVRALLDEKIKEKFGDIVLQFVRKVRQDCLDMVVQPGANDVSELVDFRKMASYLAKVFGGSESDYYKEFQEEMLTLQENDSKQPIQGKLLNPC